MKKKFYRIAILACSLICLGTDFTCSAAYVWDSDTKVKLGDVKKDEVVDVLDLARMKKHTAGKQVEITESASDINFDKEVDTDDTDLLRKQLAGSDQYWSDVY